MKKYMLFTLITFFSMNAQAASNPSYVIIASEKMASIVPNMPEIPEELKIEDAERRKQISEKGYYETYSENAILLLGQKDKKAPEYIEEESDPYHAILRQDPNAFPLSFKYKGFSSVEKDHLLGFAPSGSFENGKWTGVTGYFNDDTLVHVSLLFLICPRLMVKRFTMQNI